MSTFADRWRRLREDVAQACDVARRPRHTVRILAVSKLQPLSAIEEAFAAGVRDFGENYVQELKTKREALAHLNGIRWHLIGHLQSNKAKEAASVADVFHALDSERLLGRLEKALEEQPRPSPLPVYVQVNIDQEESKAGVAVGAELDALARMAQKSRYVEFRGLMVIPDPQKEGGYERTARVALELGRALDREQLELSMGMSDDFKKAIAAGSNWVRVGRALFGEREPR